jgi:hypothetical protein
MDRWTGAESELREYMADAGYFDYDGDDGDDEPLTEPEAETKETKWIAGVQEANSDSQMEFDNNSDNDLDPSLAATQVIDDLGEAADHNDANTGVESLLTQAYNLFQQAQQTDTWVDDYLADYPDWEGVPKNMLVVYNMTQDLLSRDKPARYIVWAADKIEVAPPTDITDDHNVMNWLMNRTLQELEDIGI